MAQPMGIGKLGDRNLIIKRKFRWTFEIYGAADGTEAAAFADIPAHFVTVAARPNISFEETELNFLNARTWIPGKGTFETITVTYLDVASRDSEPLWNWLASVYNFTDPVNLHQGSKRSDYAKTAILTMYDGCGTALETWELDDVWPQSINFGELDFSSSDVANIELTLRYSGVKYTSLCPGFTPQGTCSPCTE